MKILLVNYMETTAPGGINKAVREIAKNLTILGHDVIVLQPNPLNLSKCQYYKNFRIIRVSSMIDKHLLGLSPEMYIYLNKNLKSLKPDLIHIHGYHTLLSAEIIYLIKKTNPQIPLLFTLHYDPLNHNTIWGKLFGGMYDRFFGEKILKRVDHIISISDFEARNIKKIYRTNLSIIPNGVNDIFLVNKDKKSEIKLLYVGYLLDYKGVQHIIKSLNYLINYKKINNIYLTIIGEGNYKKSLLELSVKLNVYNYIEWKPFLPHKKILEEMKKSDIFLLLSKTEGYGIVVAEALSMGTPSIVTNGTALEEFTKENGCFGVKCPPNPKEVGELILEIHMNNIVVGPFSNKIQKWDKVVQDYEHIYLKLLKEADYAST